MKTPTCADIATACNLSPSTVSRALNNHPAIPEKTRELVLKTAKKLGWRPNPLASAYMSHLRSTRPSSFKALLGVVVDYPIADGLNEVPSHVMQSFNGFKARAVQFGYGVKMFSLVDPGVTPASFGRSLVDWNIPGLLLTSMSRPNRVLTDIRWDRYALVAIGYSMRSPAVHRVVRNMPMGVKLAIEKAFEMGYERVGIAVSEEYDLRTNHGVLFPTSFLKTQLKPGQSIDTVVYRESDPNAIDVIAKWMKKYRPDIAMGMFGMEVFDAVGWKVPQDIARVTFDRSPGFPEHAGLELKYEAMGALAADVLISEIVLNRRGIPDSPVEYTVPCQWVDGSSAPVRR